MSSVSPSAAVFVKSTPVPISANNIVKGPSSCSKAVQVVDSLGQIGYQATNFSIAVDIIRQMLVPRHCMPNKGCDVSGESPTLTHSGDQTAQLPTTSMPVVSPSLRTCRKLGVSVADETKTMMDKAARHDADPEDEFNREKLPTIIFVGAVSSMLAAPAIHSALLFLARHSMMDVFVTSGGGPEADLQLAISYYVYNNNNNNARGGTSGLPNGDVTGEISLERSVRDEISACYTAVFKGIVRIIITKQKAIMEEALKAKDTNNLDKSSVVNIKRTTDDKHGNRGDMNRNTEEEDVDIKAGRVCSWALGPSDFWRQVGELLPSREVSLLLPNLHSNSSSPVGPWYERSILYWCASNGIPIFSPSFTDGDVMDIIREAEDSLGQPSEGQSTSDKGESLQPSGAHTYISKSCTIRDTKKRTWHLPCGHNTEERVSLRNNEYNNNNNKNNNKLRIDLVRDISKLNQVAIWAKNTGMIILGGGVVKHHICNANLFRNGADYAVYINNAQEYDGSDSGARPDEAVSWGKIRSDGNSVKIYSEVSLVFPLLVAATFGKFAVDYSAPLQKE